MSQASITTGYRIAARWATSGEAEANDGYSMADYFDGDILSAVYATPEEAEEAALAAYLGEDEFGVGLEFAAIPVEAYGDGCRPASRTAALDARLAHLATARRYEANFGDGSGWEAVEAATMDEACERAEEMCREGDWGTDGACIDVTVTEEDWRGDETGRRSFAVEVEPDRSVLIRRATGGEGCGDDHDDHDWTSEGMGGCDENPGVWSLGGTAFATAQRCTRCGLVCRERTPGSQRNPGEHATVSYEMGEES